MCPGRNHSWLCNWCTYGPRAVLRQAGWLSRLCVGCHCIPTVQPKQDVVEGLWGSVIMFLSQVLREIHASWGCAYMWMCVCLHVQAHLCAHVHTGGRQRLGDRGCPHPSENFCTRHGSILSLPAILSLFLVGPCGMGHKFRKILCCL